ncbi:MAG: hypothetical protein R3B71_01830 [Candidatus Gracilibacteria bacterium]
MLSVILSAGMLLFKKIWYSLFSILNLKVMSVEYRSGEYGLLESDLVADEVQAIVEKLEALRSRVECIEGTEGFVAITIVDRITLNINRDGLELSLEIQLGNSTQKAGAALNPEPETVIQGLANVVEVTPALISMGYKRKAWGVYEDSYVAEFTKSLDSSELDQLLEEVEAMIDCFADSNGTT